MEMHFYVLIVEMLRCVDVEVVYRLRQSRRLPPAFIAGQHLRVGDVHFVIEISNIWQVEELSGQQRKSRERFRIFL
jgi:hypothetical protein